MRVNNYIMRHYLNQITWIRVNNTYVKETYRQNTGKIYTIWRNKRQVTNYYKPINKL